LAETEGFEPSMRLYTPYSLSSSDLRFLKALFHEVCERIYCIILALGGKMVAVDGFLGVSKNGSD